MSVTFAQHRIVVVLSLLLVSLSGMVFAEDTGRVLRVGVENQAYYPLFSFSDDEHKEGALERILNRFAAKHGITFEYVPLPITRFSRWYEEERIDFRVPDNPLWQEKQKDLLYSDPVMHLSQSTVVLKSHESLKMTEFERLGTLYGFTPSKHWQARIQSGDVKLVTDNSVKMLVRFLFNGVVQGLDLDMSVVRYYAGELGYDTRQLTVARHIPEGRVAYRMSTYHHPEILQKLNRFIGANEHQIVALMLAKGIQ